VQGEGLPKRTAEGSNHFNGLVGRSVPDALAAEAPRKVEEGFIVIAPAAPKMLTVKTEDRARGQRRRWASSDGSAAPGKALVPSGLRHVRGPRSVGDTSVCTDDPRGWLGGWGGRKRLVAPGHGRPDLV